MPIDRNKFMIICALSWLLISPAIGITSEVMSTYPQINIMGYKKWLYDEITVDPSRNYFSYLSSFEAWRTDRGRGTWLELLDLSIAGELSEDLGVHYRLFQAPYGLETFNVAVNYKNYDLLFGDLNRLIFADKALFAVDYFNGVSLSGKWGTWSAGLIPSAKYPKSDAKGDYNNLIYFRSPRYNGQKIPILDDDPNLEYWGFDLGDISINKKDVKLFIDNKRLPDNYFYFVNGLFLFSATFKDGEIAKVIISRSNGQSEEKVYAIKKEARRRAFLIPYFRLRDRTETVRIDGMQIYRGLDYGINYNLGLIVLNRPIPEDAEVKIDYKYSASSKSQSPFAGWIENDMTDWDKIGFSYMIVSRADRSSTNPEFTILNLNNRLNINESTYVYGEMSASNGTAESGNAIRIEGVTKQGALTLSGAYESVDPNFASVRKVREGISSKANEGTINAEYGLNDNLTFRAGYGRYSTQEGSATAETSAAINSIGFTWKPISTWLTEGEYKINRGVAEIKTLGLYQRFGLIDQSQPAHWLSKASDIILKYSLNNNYVDNNKSTKWQCGWQNDFIGGLSLYLNWANEDVKDLTTNINLQKAGPFGRISYKVSPWDGINVEIYSDYSTIQQRASNISSDQKDIAYGVMSKAPIGNPVLSGFDLGIEVKTSEYTDNLNALNSYKTSEVRFQGVLDF